MPGSRPRKAALSRRFGLAAAVAVHVVVLAGLARVHGLDFLPSPPIEVELVRPLAMDVPPPPPAASKSRTEPVKRQPSGAPPPDDPGPAPTALSAASAGVDADASARYRLLAAPFNVCPTLLVNDQVFRHGSTEQGCTEGRDEGKTRQYALDQPATHVTFGDKDDQAPASIQVPNSWR